MVSGMMALVVLLFLTSASFKVIEVLGAGEIMVVQSPWTGNLTWYTTPGPKPQLFGHVTKYKKQDQYWFEKEDRHNQETRPLKMRFNDAAHATISGSIAWEMPLDVAPLTALHSKYGSQSAVELQLVRTVVEKSVYMTGPLMSSTESYAARRNELLSYIEDQVMHGVYKTDVRTEKTRDPLTGQEKTVQIVDLAKKADGTYQRETASPLEEFHIRTYNLSINEVEYDADVERQIKQQQEALMKVQTAIAQAKTAEQDTITTEQKGKASAAEAKWAQEVLKAKAVTEAQQKVEVAALDALALKTNAVIEAQQKYEVAELNLKAAELKKQTDIASGEGEAKKRELIMQADGALEKKLAAWTDVNKAYAEAIKGHQGSWVPNVILGQGGGTGMAGGSNAAADLVGLLTAKTAMELGLDMRFGNQQIKPAVAQK